ncbi:hypothetical protein [Caudoviricetes sp.]|nr:hypothetical protein [Caudoviricetes sp.]
MPPVRELQSLIAEQQQAIAPQKALIDQSIEQNAAAGAAQEAGLAATQKKAFGNIEQAAQNKGMFFSGFSPDQQAEYTSSTYLPALAQLQATIAQTRSNLLGKKADLDSDVFKTATGMRENDIQILRNWEKMTAEQQFNASEAEKQRVFQARENEATRQHESRQNAANRAASAPKDVSGIVNSVGSFLAGRTGSDGKVSPASFQEGRQQWIAAGGSPDSYNQAFAGYVNTDHYWNYYGAK